MLRVSGQGILERLESKTRTDDTSLFSVQPVVRTQYLPFILECLQSWDLP
jgi:hypothetical protein